MIMFWGTIFRNIFKSWIIELWAFELGNYVNQVSEFFYMKKKSGK